MDFDATPLDRLFAEAERCTALLQRSAPLNGREELARLTREVRRGECPSPRLRYARPADLSAVRRALEAARTALQGRGSVGELYAERAAELDAEARLAEALGSPDLRELSRRHFASSDREEARAEALAERWLSSSVAGDEETALSDDTRDPRSLISVVSREVGRLRLPFRVAASPDLPSLAATSPDTIWIRTGARLPVDLSHRVALHEVLGHAAVRALSVHQPLGLLRVGSAGAAADEEGRALRIEERLGLPSPARRRELARRHRAAMRASKGADLPETVRDLLEQGCEPDAAVRVALRIHRGGGLARERIYLPAMLRVDAALASRPELEGYMRCGRVSANAAERLLAARIHPSRDAS